MIIELVESIEITGLETTTTKWFYQGQQYAFIGSRPLTPDLVFVVVIDEIEYEIPEYACALLRNELPSTDMRSAEQRMHDSINRNVIVDIYGKHDMVKAVKDIFKVDIAAKEGADQCDYDGNALRLLQERRQVQEEESRQVIGFNERAQEPTAPVLPPDDFADEEFGPEGFENNV